MESRKEVAKNRQEAEEAEILSEQEIALKRKRKRKRLASAGLNANKRSALRTKNPNRK